MADDTGATEQRLLNRYRLVERLEVGGSATVWRAHDEQLDRAVAVKRLHPHLLPDDTSRRRLAAEARAAASLSHPGIVGIYDVDVDGEAPALVMELVEGESLAARIARDGQIPAGEAARITAEVAEALYHAHTRGVIHRDVKPGNILLDSSGRARLVDFGIAHSLAPSAERLTLTGTVIGTLRYMAPEQLEGTAVGPRTDLFGLGVVLAESLTGRPPYAASSPVVLAQEQAAGPPSLEGAEPALAAVARACLAPDPGARPLHAGAVALALREWLEGRKEAAFSLGPAAIVPASQAEANTQAVTQPMSPVAFAPPSATDRPVRPAVGPAKRGAPVGVMAVAGVVALAAVVFALLSPFDDTVGIGPTASPTPSPTLAPEWLAGLVEEFVEDCPGGDVATLEADVAGMSKKAAEDHVKDLTEECDEAREDGGGGDGNNGRGNGRGRGGDNDEGDD